ncbi:AI-2E family transporter [Haloarchaeobius amylolyticus]|uniref:AI-2E family transporter n=1 Tax=Haloarchaeobius amylolyticus TaxID=1198296 RepID=A0ABD6BGL8_9EURY
MDTRSAVFALLSCILGALAALIVLPLVEYVLAACLLAVALRPVYERLVPHTGPRTAGIILTGLAVGGGIVPLVVVSLVILDTATSVLETVSADAIAASSRSFARTTLGLDETAAATLEAALSSELAETIGTATDVTVSQAVGLVTTVADIVAGTLVFVVVLYSLLVDGPAVIDWVRRITPLERRLVDELLAEVHVVVWAVLRSHLLVAVVQGILGGLGLVLLGVPYATVLAVALSLVAVVPAIGIWLVWGPVTVAHAISSGPLGGVVLLGYGLAVLAVVDTYLRALLVDRGSGLHPAIALVGVVGGGVLFGLVGLFVGPVVLAAFKASVTVLDRLERSPSADADADSDSNLERETSFTEIDP